MAQFNFIQYFNDDDCARIDEVKGRVPVGTLRCNLNLLPSNGFIVDLEGELVRVHALDPRH